MTSLKRLFKEKGKSAPNLQQANWGFQEIQQLGSLILKGKSFLPQRLILWKVSKCHMRPENSVIQLLGIVVLVLIRYQKIVITLVDTIGKPSQQAHPLISLRDQTENPRSASAVKFLDPTDANVPNAVLGHLWGPSI